MKIYKHVCSVYGCSQKRGDGAALHHFPKDRNLRKKWGHILKIGKRVTENMFVCSFHFSEGDFFPQKIHGVKKRLKFGVVPSINLPKSTIQTGSNQNSKETRNDRYKEKVLDLFEKDAVMVNKGFAIADETYEKGITLIRPAFLRQKKQFSSTEYDENVNIARARVHVERAIGKMKVFDILRQPVDTTLVYYLDEIVKIISGVVNMSNPILAENKF